MYVITKRCLFICLFLITLCTVSCSDDADVIKFKVICTGVGGGDFNGYYIVDGDDTIGLTDGIVPIDSNCKQYEKELDDMDDLRISASRVDKRDQLEILVYRDDSNVKEATLDPSPNEDYPTMTLILTYEYGEEDTSGSSSGSSDD